MSEVSIKTPSFNHLSTVDLDLIYAPSEDTFLLIDALEKDLKEIVKLEPCICLEIGVGSGVVITALGSALGPSSLYFGTDVNEFACKKAEETAHLNGVTLKTFCCNFVDNVPDSVKGSVDVLIFNPPYVVTESDEILSSPLASAWAGGEKGREVIDKLFPSLSSILSPRGVFYLLLEKNNKPKEVSSILEHLGFSSTCILSRKNLSETLYVMKFTRKL
ncbi:HemK methyltransferase family member 2 [Armadillidium vulgare]|nr:HemK methyltransferase family member 2 [Armadillidium vulgare]